MSRLKSLLAIAVAALAVSAHAAWPEKPIRIVVAFAPGSTTDVVARSVAQNLSVALGQNVLVENRPGAGGNIATVQVAKAPPDGYTLLMHSVAYSINPSMFSNAGYQVGDLAAVAMTGVAPNMLYVHPDVKAANLKELVALMKKEPLSYASSGNGTTTQLGAELLFRNLLGLQLTHVPYQPAAAANAVVSGQVPLGSTSMPPVVQLAKAGKVRPIAVTSLQRSPALPDVPTVAELGYPGFEASTWIALFAPAGTPPELLDRLNAEVNKVLLYKTLNDSFGALSLDTLRLDRKALTAYIDNEARKWGGVVRQIGAKVD